jgi:hypothetical protein
LPDLFEGVRVKGGRMERIRELAIKDQLLA